MLVPMPMWPPSATSLLSDANLTWVVVDDWVLSTTTVSEPQVLVEVKIGRASCRARVSSYVAAELKLVKADATATLVAAPITVPAEQSAGLVVCFWKS